MISLYKGINYIMDINGALMQIEGELVSDHINQTLLPFYAQILNNIHQRQDYELNNAVCFVCDCLVLDVSRQLGTIKLRVGSSKSHRTNV